MKRYTIIAALTVSQLDYLKSLAAQHNIQMEVFVSESDVVETQKEEEAPRRTPITDEHIARIAKETGKSLRYLLELQDSFNVETLEDICGIEGCPDDIYDVVENILANEYYPDNVDREYGDIEGVLASSLPKSNILPVEEDEEGDYEEDDQYYYDEEDEVEVKLNLDGRKITDEMIEAVASALGVSVADVRSRASGYSVEDALASSQVPEEAKAILRRFV